jgi:aspartate kinase
MDIKVIKFGGSSLANDENLKKAAQKTIQFLKDNQKVVAILSAQGKTTDTLLTEAKRLSANPNKRELDMLVSIGEQISISKFAILLNEMGYKAISLTGEQAGIITDENYTQAKIQEIHPYRVWKELEKYDVIIVAGFQGIDMQRNITTLGRNGSDTSAVAIAAALEQKECYIFTDTDGIYDKDPNQHFDARKIESISYEDMDILVQNGAKVLHDRCIRIAKKYGIKIIVKSTFNDKQGSIVQK